MRPLTLASMLKVTRTALTGKPFTNFVLKEDQDIYHNHRQPFLETKISQSCELHLVKKGGEPFYTRLECVVLKSKEHDLKQFGAVINDITKSKQIEKKLKQNALELEEMNTALKVLPKSREQDHHNIEKEIFANYPFIFLIQQSL